MRHGFRSTIVTTMIAVTALLASGCGSDSGTAVAVAASIVLTPSSTASIASIGDTRTVTAVVKDASLATLPNASVTWASSNPAVLTVVGSGSSATVTSTGNGSATITATSGAASANVSLTVAQVFASLGLTAAAPSIGIGATSALTAAARDAKGATIAGVTTGFTFTTSAATVAIVSATGLVTGIAPGSATITGALTTAGVTSTGTAAITVTAPTASPTTASIAATTGNQFTPASATIAVGGTATWAIAGSTHTVTFSAANAPASIAATSNASVSRTFGTAGTFAYVCTIHAGMTGSILVQAPSFFAGAMNGANERPTANALTGNGSAVFTVSGTTVSYTVAFQGISGAPTGLHIHAPSGANATAAVIVDLLTTPQTATSGVLTGTFTASAIRNAAVSLDSLFVLMRNGNAYVNLHTTAFPGGEIRGAVTTP